MNIEERNGRGRGPAAMGLAGIVLAGLAAAALTVIFFRGGPKEQHFTFIGIAFCLGLLFGMLLISPSRLELWQQRSEGRREITCLLSFGALGAGFLYWCGMRQFGGFDHSIVIDTAWRLYSGQRPYVDFPCTVPIGFYLGAEAAFRLFGVYWSSIIKVAALYFLFTYFWGYIVLRQVFANRYLGLALVIGCESMSLLLDSYWWYNPITGVAVMVYIASVAAVMLRPKSNWLWVSFCISLLLAALMKPNISGMAIAGGAIALLADRRTALRSVVCSLAAFALWLGSLKIHGSNIGQVLESYFSVSSRNFAPQFFLLDTNPAEKVFAWLCLAMLLGGIVWIKWWKIEWRRRAKFMILAAFTVAGSLAGFYGDGEPKLVDLAPGLLAVAILMAEPADTGEALQMPRAALCYLLVVCSAFTFSSLGEGIVRNRVRGVGPGTFFEYAMDPKPFETGFFKGLTAGHNLHVTYDVISQLVSNGKTVNPYFGPRLQWAYAAFGLPSPKGMPIWWHPGVAFPKADEAMYTQRWAHYNFDPLVVLDIIYMNGKVVDWINNHYVITQIQPLTKDSGPLVVMRRKG